MSSSTKTKMILKTTKGINNVGMNKNVVKNIIKIKNNVTNKTKISKKNKITDKKKNKKIKKSLGFKTYIKTLLQKISEENNNNTTNNKKMNISGIALMQLNASIEFIAEKISYLAKNYAIYSKKFTITTDNLKCSIFNITDIIFAEIINSRGNLAVDAFLNYNNKDNNKKNISKAKRSNLIFSPALAKKYLKDFGTSKIQVTATASSYLAGALEFITREILVGAAKNMILAKKLTITPKYIMLAINDDQSLYDLFKLLNIKMVETGVISYIPKEFTSKKLLRKKEKAKKAILKKYKISGVIIENKRISSYTKAIESIKKEQNNSTNLILPKINFARGVRNILNNLITNFKLGKKSLFLLQHYVEKATIDFFQYAVELVIHAGRETLTEEDIFLTLKLRGLKTREVSYGDRSRKTIHNQPIKEYLPFSRLKKLARRAAVLRINNIAQSIIPNVVSSILYDIIKACTIVLIPKKTKIITPIVLKIAAKTLGINLPIDNSTKSIKKIKQ